MFVSENGHQKENGDFTYGVFGFSLNLARGIVEINTSTCKCAVVTANNRLTVIVVVVVVLLLLIHCPLLPNSKCFEVVGEHVDVVANVSDVFGKVSNIVPKNLGIVGKVHDIALDILNLAVQFLHIPSKGLDVVAKSTDVFGENFLSFLNVVQTSCNLFDRPSQSRVS